MAIPAIRHWPMLRVFVPFASGICLQLYTELPRTLLLTVFMAGLLILLLYNQLKSAAQFRLSLLAGIIMALLPMAAGMIIMNMRTTPAIPPLLGRAENSKAQLILQISTAPTDRLKTLNAIAEIREWRLADSNIHIAGRILISFLKDSSLPMITNGQVILVQKLPDTIADNSNPAGFNFKEYNVRQGIRYQLFLTKKDFKVLGAQVSLLENFLQRITNYILVTIRRFVKGQEEAGLAEALLIGYKNDLDKDLIQSYSNTGVVHVIAISGLHLALIYWILGRACDLLHMHPKRVRPFVVISGLWIFALLAGGSPSVVRSAVMFSVIVAGELLQRKTHILNSLAASAFLLLCYNPYWLWDLGFQLSYVAVLSLILAAKPINNAVYFSNPALAALWNLVSVTLAAQVLTTPLILFNFHKFPLLFLFTNCICVPLSSLLLIGELLLCSLGWSPVLGGWLGFLLLHSLRFMNEVVRFFEKYPISSFQPIQINVIQTLILYVLIAVCMWWAMHRRKTTVFYLLPVIICFSLIRAVSFYCAYRQAKLVIYNIPGKVSVDFFKGRTVRNLEYINYPTNETEVRRYVLNNRIQSRVLEKNVKLEQLTGQKFYMIAGLKLACLSSAEDRFPDNQGVIDILIVSHNSLLKSTKAITGMKLRMVVADASNSRASLGRYRAFFRRLNIPYHSVSEQGAFVRNLN